MRPLFVLMVVCVALASVGCQRRSVPYGGIDESKQDKAAVQPDPARAE